MEKNLNLSKVDENDLVALEAEPEYMLMIAIENGDSERVNQIIELKNSGAIESFSYLTAVRIAVKYGRLGIVMRLFGAEPLIFEDVKEAFDCYRLALESCNEDIAEFIASVTSGMELVEASRKGDVELINDVIDMNPDIIGDNAIDMAFIVACENNRVDVVNRILAIDEGVLESHFVSQYSQNFSKNVILSILNQVSDEVINSSVVIGMITVSSIHNREIEFLREIFKLKPNLVNKLELFSEFGACISGNNIDFAKRLLSVIEAAKIDISKNKHYVSIFKVLTLDWEHEMISEMLKVTGGSHDIIKMVHGLRRGELGKIERKKKVSLIINAVHSNIRTPFTDIIFTRLLCKAVGVNDKVIIDGLLGDATKELRDAVYYRSMPNEQPAAAKIPYLPNDVKKYLFDGYINSFEPSSDDFLNAYKHTRGTNSLFKHAVRYCGKSFFDSKFPEKANEDRYNKFRSILNYMLSDLSRNIPEDQILEGLKTVVDKKMPDDIGVSIVYYAMDNMYKNAIEFAFKDKRIFQNVLKHSIDNEHLKFASFVINKASADIIENLFVSALKDLDSPRLQSLYKLCCSHKNSEFASLIHRKAEEMSKISDKDGLNKEVNLILRCFTRKIDSAGVRIPVRCERNVAMVGSAGEGNLGFRGSIIPRGVS